jgi:Bacterial alpha-L-rhamnosidase C-terminal domain
MADPSTFLSISTQLTTNWGPIGAKCPELPNNIVPYVEGMEVKGHLAARQATRALALMRLSWGWYLNNPFGSNSTMIEGYLQDGTFGYRTGNGGYENDFSYASHAHGWSTGPTHALSTYVVGIQLLSPGGGTWMLAPQLGGLTSVEGGFTTNLGTFSAKWALNKDGYSLEYNMHSGTTGTLVLPAAGIPTVTLDGKADTAGVYNASSGLVTLGNQPGGTHTLLLVAASSTQTATASAATTTASKKNGGGSPFQRVPNLLCLLSVAAIFALL